MTLPPGMTKREAEGHDFFRDRAEVQLKEHLEQLAKNPRDHILLAGLGHLYFKVKNNAAAERGATRYRAPTTSGTEDASTMSSGDSRDVSIRRCQPARLAGPDSRAFLSWRSARPRLAAR